MLIALKSTLMTLPLMLVSVPAQAADVTNAASGGGSATGLSGLKPDSGAIPGGEQAKSLLQGVMFYGLVAAAISLVLSAGLMGIGKWRRNPGHVESGQSGVLWSLAGAAAIGGCGALIGWAFNLGTTIR
jgi:hypothetical protein